MAKGWVLNNFKRLY